MTRIFAISLVCLMMVACTPAREVLFSEEGNDDILYILPDGTMEFRGRIISDEDVIIYEDGRGGERAAVKLDLPLYNHVWRDTIVVDRVTLDVPIARKASD